MKLSSEISSKPLSTWKILSQNEIEINLKTHVTDE